VYRDGCKQSQPVAASGARDAVSRNGRAEAPALVVTDPAASGSARRRRLPDERHAITHKFSIGGHEGYLTVGLYEDGRPGEIFLVMAKEGSTISGLMDAVATSISIALQHGVPLPILVAKLAHTRYEPSGLTRHPAIPVALSLTDYVCRWLGWKFLPKEQWPALGILDREETTARDEGATPPARVRADAPPCPTCGTLMTRSGSCFRCGNCGATTGCG